MTQHEKLKQLANQGFCYLEDIPEVYRESFNIFTKYKRKTYIDGKEMTFLIDKFYEYIEKIEHEFSIN